MKRTLVIICFGMLLSFCAPACKAESSTGAPSSSTLDNRGCALQRVYAYDAALSDFDQAIKLDPSYALAYSHRAHLLEELGEFDKAMLDYNRVVALRPNEADAYFDRGYALGNAAPAIRDLSDKWRKRILAIKDLNKALELNPRYRSAYEARGFARAGTNDVAGAIDDLTQAIKLRPSAVDYAVRGYFREMRGELSEAVSDLDEAISCDKTVATFNVFSARARLRAATGNIYGAIQDFVIAYHWLPSQGGWEEQKWMMVKLVSETVERKLRTMCISEWEWWHGFQM